MVNVTARTRSIPVLQVASFALPTATSQFLIRPANATMDTRFK